MDEKNLKSHKVLDDLFEAFMVVSRGEYVSLYDIKNNVMRCSPALVELFGMQEYTHDGAAKWIERLHPEDRRRYKNIVAETDAGKLSTYDLSNRVRLQDGSYIVTRNIGAVIRDVNGEPAFVGGIMINEGLVENTDPITVLRNQTGFFQDISAAIELKKNCVVLLLGINKMSLINGESGYDFGNKVLQHLAWFLQENLGQDGTLYRMDGAKFAFVTENFSAEEISAKYEKIRRSLLGGLPMENLRQVLVLNSGLVTYNGADVDKQTIFSCLNRAYNDSKTRRNGKLVNYNGATGKNLRESMEMINEIRNCIVMDCEGFSLHYQPIVSAMTERLVAAEALLCWRSEKFGEVSPAAYVPVLERDFLFEELGYWIFKQAMKDGAKILEKTSHFTMNVNVSPAQLTDEFLVEELVKISNATNFPLENLCLEITASCRQIEPEILKKVVFSLKEKNVRCLLDDFGAGVSSLEFLQDLKPDYVKPERKYVTDIDESRIHLQIIKHLTTMAVELGSEVCVKGIATAVIRDIIRQLPVRALQGYYYSDSLPFESLLQKFFLIDN